MHTLIKTLAFAAALGVSAYAATGYQMSVCADQKHLCYNGNTAFLSGMNLAWFNFSQDVGRQGWAGSLLYVDENKVRTAFKNLRAAGGNVMRWWLYTNNAMDPIIDTTTNMTTGIEASTISNVQTMLDIAQEYGVVVDICLLSFDMAKKDSYSANTTAGWSRYNFTADSLMLVDTNYTRAFITNAVVPLVKQFKNHPALLGWEIFNEPEGMTSTDNFGSGWGTVLFDIKYIQRFINMTADAIHNEAPENLVSNGSAKITMTSGTTGTNYYTDALLLAAGDNNYPNGKLDFYQVHYYPEWSANTDNPFKYNVSHWNLDKPLMIGEIPGASWTADAVNNHASSGEDRRMVIDSAYTFAFDSSYAGIMGWTLMPEAASSSYGNVTWCLDSTKAALTNLFNLHESYINLDTSVKIADASGENGWMKVTYTDITDTGTQLKYSLTSDLSSATTISFTVYNSGTASFSYGLVLQTNANDNWGWYQSTDDNACVIPAGDTVTCSFTLTELSKSGTAMTAANLANLYSIFLISFSTGYSGAIYVDNVVTDNGIVIHNFDTEFDLFSPANNGTSAITSVETYYDGTAANIKLANNAKVQNLRYAAHTLQVSFTKAGFAAIDIYDVKGNKAAALYHGTLSAGTHSFSLGKLANGLYVVRARSASGTATQKILVK